MDELERSEAAYEQAKADARETLTKIRVDRELSIRRLRARIDRALDVGNRRQFIELCRLLRDYQGSRAPIRPEAARQSRVGPRRRPDHRRRAVGHPRQVGPRADLRKVSFAHRRETQPRLTRG